MREHRTEFARWILLAVVALVACRATEPSDTEAFIHWAAEQAVQVEDFGAPISAGEREALSDLVAGARLVGLGESRHDSREQLLFKARLARVLIEDHDFRGLLLEESFAHTDALDHYVTTGEGEPRRLLNDLAGWYLWDTEEMLAFVEWIRELNAGRPMDRRVRVFGVDITAPAPGVRRVLALLEAAGIDDAPDAALDTALDAALDTGALGLELHAGDAWGDTWARYAELSPSRRAAIGEAYDALVAQVESARERLVTATSESTFDHTLQLAEIGRQAHALFASGDRAAAGTIRERGMAQSLQWLLDHELAGEKAILWAHNLHVATCSFRMPGLAEGALEPMGILVDAELGDAYVAVGATFGHGTYTPELPPGGRTFETPPVEVMDGVLAAIGPARFLLDLRTAAEEPAALGWLQQDRTWRAQDADASLVPAEAFDAVFFVDEITRAQPTALALERFGAP